MSLNADDVLRMAHLARIEIREDEIAGVVDKLQRIVGFVAQLELGDAERIEPMAHSLEVGQRLRADEVVDENRRDLYQRNAPAVEQGLYVVPRVIE